MTYTTVSDDHLNAKGLRLVLSKVIKRHDLTFKCAALHYQMHMRGLPHMPIMVIDSSCELATFSAPADIGGENIKSFDSSTKKNIIIIFVIVIIITIVIVVNIIINIIIIL